MSAGAVAAVEVTLALLVTQARTKGRDVAARRLTASQFAVAGLAVALMAVDIGLTSQQSPGGGNTPAVVFLAGAAVVFGLLAVAALIVKGR